MPDPEALPAEGRYVYAVLPAAGAPTGPLTGIDDAPVEFVELGELAAATSVISLDRPPGRRHDLLAHSRLLESLVESTTAVPVEFGAVLADRESVVEDLLAPGEGYFVELIRRLEGTQQFNLRATYDESQGACRGGAGEPAHRRPPTSHQGPSRGRLAPRPRPPG